MKHVLAAALLLSTSLPAMAQMDSREGIALQNEILALRQQVQILQEQIARGGGGASPYGAQRGGGPIPLSPYVQTPNPQAQPGAGGDIAAELLDRVSRLEDQVRTLQGRTDELANQVQTQGADLSKQIGDLNFRLGNGGPAPSAPPPPSGPVQGQAAPAQPHRTPEVALQEGNAALARRDYPAAAAAAREVLANGRGPRTTDAQFLLSEAEAGSHNYQQAAIDYYDAYNRSKSGVHAADSLLGVATSLTALNDKQAACQALDKLRTEFPNPRPDLRDRAAAARRSAGCR